MIPNNRAEAARLRFLRDNKQLITQEVVEVLRATPEEAVKATPPAVDPLVLDILKELRRLSKAIEEQPDVPAPIVNVSPSLSPAPYVNVQPTVSVDTHREWEVTVEHHKSGPLQGKIWKANFRALS